MHFVFLSNILGFSTAEEVKYISYNRRTNPASILYKSIAGRERPAIDL